MQSSNISISKLIELKGGTVEELRQYAKSKGIYLPNDVDYVLSISELNSIDPLIAYKQKWRMALKTDSHKIEEDSGNKPREFLDAVFTERNMKEKATQEKKAERKRLKRERMSEMAKAISDKIEEEKHSSESYAIKIGLKKPKRKRMARTPNPPVVLERKSVTSFTVISSKADVESVLLCFTWPSPKYNREDDFYVQRLIGNNQEVLDYYHMRMKAFFGVDHVLKKEYEARKAKMFVEDDSTDIINIPPKNIDDIVQGAKRELNALGEALIKQLDKRQHANAIKYKNNSRVVKLPQPIAQLACSGLFENIAVSYLGGWRPNEVLLIYADDETPQSKEKLKQDNEMFSVYYNAVLMGNFPQTYMSEAYIGLIELGNKIYKQDHKRYINIVGAELFDNPSEEKPNIINLCKTHVVTYKNITLEKETIKIPISEMAWKMIENDNFISFYWEKKFEGFLFSPNHYRYLFFSGDKQRLYKPCSLDEEWDDEEEADVAVYQGKNSDGQKFLCFDLSKLEEKKRPSTAFDVLQKKEWILDWNCVRFKQGYFVVSPPSDGKVKFKPEAVSSPGVLESFNYLKDYLNDRLQPIHCSVEGMKLTIYDTIRLNEAIEKFTAISRQRAITTGESTQRRIAPAQMSFKQAMSKAQQMTPEDFKKYKSEYIDFLVKQQSKKYKVIPCVERLSHANNDITEYAFMFSVKCNSGEILIVHENVNPDRSTLLFVVKESQYDKAIRAIYDFLQSAEINKRSSLRDGNLKLADIGIERYSSINHDGVYYWQRVIRSYKLYYKNGSVFII